MLVLPAGMSRISCRFLQGLQGETWTTWISRFETAPELQ
jgi:hypothetical protein